MSLSLFFHGGKLCVEVVDEVVPVLHFGSLSSAVLLVHEEFVDVRLFDPNLLNNLFWSIILRVDRKVLEWQVSVIALGELPFKLENKLNIRKKNVIKYLLKNFRK